MKECLEAFSFGSCLLAFHGSSAKKTSFPENPSTVLSNRLQCPFFFSNFSCESLLCSISLAFLPHIPSKLGILHFIKYMASGTVAKRLLSLSGLGKFSQDLKTLPRTFSTAAAKAEDAVEVERKDNGKAPSARGRPSSLFSDVFSPFGNPVTSFLQMMDTMDRVLDTPFMSHFPASRNLRSSNRTPWDVNEDEKAFKLRLDMLGFDKEHVNIEVEDGDLTIKGEHKAEETKEDWSSRSYGSYNMRIKLPENVDINCINAELKNGVLKIVAPKSEVKKERLEVKLN